MQAGQPVMPLGESQDTTCPGRRKHLGEFFYAWLQEIEDLKRLTRFHADRLGRASVRKNRRLTSRADLGRGVGAMPGFR